MRLLCLSDQHGFLPVYDAGAYAADVAVIAGDVTPADRKHTNNVFAQEIWFRDVFVPWTQTLPVKHIVMTWGNHDHLGLHRERYDYALPSNLHVLVNESCVIDGVQFYGVPQTPRFFDWAFNNDDTPEDLGRFWEAVPLQTDVLISHGPPRGTVDWVNDRRGERVGSKTQADWLLSGAPNTPRVIVCGHIHGSGGHQGICGRTSVVNASLLSERYALVNAPQLIPYAKDMV